MLTPTPHPEEPGALNKVFLAREFNFENGILLSARKTSRGRDWDGVWSRFLSHEVTRGRAGPPWPHCPQAFSLPPTHPCAGTGCPGAPPPSLRPGTQIAASSSAVLGAPYYAVPTQATGAPAPGTDHALMPPWGPSRLGGQNSRSQTWPPPHLACAFALPGPSASTVGPQVRVLPLPVPWNSTCSSAG